MQKYRIFDSATLGNGENAARDVYRGTQDAAKKEMQKWPADQRHDIRIELVVVRTDGAAIESYLNGLQPENPLVLKTWRGTPRGGLVELDAAGKDLERAE